MAHRRRSGGGAAFSTKPGNFDPPSGKSDSLLNRSATPGRLEIVEPPDSVRRRKPLRFMTDRYSRRNPRRQQHPRLHCFVTKILSAAPARRGKCRCRRCRVRAVGYSAPRPARRGHQGGLGFMRAGNRHRLVGLPMHQQHRRAVRQFGRQASRARSARRRNARMARGAAARRSPVNSEIIAPWLNPIIA